MRPQGTLVVDITSERISELQKSSRAIETLREQNRGVADVDAVCVFFVLLEMTHGSERFHIEREVVF